MAGRPRNAGAGAAILAAAMDVLRRRGYAALTMDEVASVAGVGKSSLYRRFHDKAQLAVAALASLQREAPATVGAIRDDLIAQLRAGERDLAGAGAEVLGTVLGVNARLEHDGLMAARARQLRRLLEAAQRRGEVAAEHDLDGVLAGLTGALLVRLLLPRLSPEPWPQRVVDVLLPSPAGVDQRSSVSR